MRYQYNQALKKNARDLRKNQTDMERILWSHLRSRQLCGLKFRRQFPIQQYILNFYCPERRIAIELDGGQHNTDAYKIRDQERDMLLARMNIIVLRFWNNEIIENIDGVVAKILMTVK